MVGNSNIQEVTLHNNYSIHIVPRSRPDNPFLKGHFDLFVPLGTSHFIPMVYSRRLTYKHNGLGDNVK